MDDTKARVEKIIADHLGVEPERVVADVRLCPPAEAMPIRAGSPQSEIDLGADSLDIVELVMAFEDEFEIEVPDDEASKLNDGTVGDAIKLVEAKVDAGKARPA